MKKIGVIPARYNSSRLQGKPLADICGKPMIWWVYNQAKKVKNLDDVLVAVDNDIVMEKCNELGINAILTDVNHSSHIHRLFEVANKVYADLYVCICGDEPLIEPEVIEQIIPTEYSGLDDLYIGGMRRILNDPVETIDPGNIKIIVDKDNYGLALSRTPIPYPYKTLNYNYYKTIGIECFNKKALEFYVNSDKGLWEQVEDIMMLRFIENRIKVKFTLVESKSLSVDTEKDLERVRCMIKEKMNI